MSCAAYLINGERFEADSTGFVEALAAAHATRHRPRCLCTVDGVEMYVARLGDDFIIKRMPNTGSHHTADCISYEPPAELSGLGQVLGSAIKEDPATGLTSLKLAFPMSKTSGRPTSPSVGSEAASVASDSTKLTLRGLLHYLWDQAELTRWQPGFAGKRSWATVRKHLLQAAENKIAHGEELLSKLYVPEMFYVERRDEINARRVAQWLQAAARPGATQHLMLLIAEVKAIVPARYGFKAVLKHLPDQPLMVDPVLYRRLARRFEGELSLWGATDSLHMVIVATFGLNDIGVPTIEELSLMPTSEQWIPVRDRFELALVEALVRSGGGRRFRKGLRYNASSDSTIPAAVLLDTEIRPYPLYIRSTGSLNDSRFDHSGGGFVGWLWDTSKSPLPSLPSALPQSG